MRQSWLYNTVFCQGFTSREKVAELHPIKKILDTADFSGVSFIACILALVIPHLCVHGPYWQNYGAKILDFNVLNVPVSESLQNTDNQRPSLIMTQSIITSMV